MHTLKGLEKLNSKFYTMQETVVDIEVKTSEAEEAAEEVQNISSEIDEDLDTVEGANDEIETLRLYQEHLKKYPLTKASYSLINLNNGLSKYSNQLVAVEAFNASVTNDVVIAGIEGILDTVIGKIQGVVKGVISKFKALLDKAKMMISDWKSGLEAAQRLIQNIPDTSSSNAGSRVVNGVDFKQCDQIISSIETLSAKIKNMGDIVYFEGKQLAVKSVLDIFDKKTLDTIGFDKSKYPSETKIDAAKFSKQELSSMCSKLIKSCQSLEDFSNLLWNIVNHVPDLLNAITNKSLGDVLIKAIQEQFNTAAGRLQRNLRAMLKLETAAVKSLSTCNKSFIRIAKARANA